MAEPRRKIQSACLRRPHCLSSDITSAPCSRPTHDPGCQLIPHNPSGSVQFLLPFLRRAAGSIIQLVPIIAARLAELSSVWVPRRGLLRSAAAPHRHSRRSSNKASFCARNFTNAQLTHLRGGFQYQSVVFAVETIATRCQDPFVFSVLLFFLCTPLTLGPYSNAPPSKPHLPLASHICRLHILGAKICSVSIIAEGADA